MSNRSTSIGDGAPPDPDAAATSAGVMLVDADAWDAVQAELASLRRMLRGQLPQIPEAHKYSLSKKTVTAGGEEVAYCEVGIRLVSGYRPEDLSDDRLLEEAKRAPSRRTIQRLVADEDGVLRAIKVGGSTFVTERSIQHYEQGLNEGWIRGYEVLDAVKARK